MKFLIIGFITICIFAKLAFGEITTIKTFDQITQKIEELKKDYAAQDILVIFTLENTIAHPKNPRLKFPEDPPALDSPIVNKIFSNLNLKKSSYISDIIFTEYEQELTDKDIPQAITEIQKLSSPIIIFSKGLIGKLNKVPRLEVNKADILQKFGIDLSKTFSKDDFFIQEISANSAKFKSKNETEVFYKAIITYNDISLSSALTNFLIQIKYMPLVVIITSYKESDLIGVEAQLNSFNKDIKFIGYHYKAANQSNYQGISADQASIDFWQQFIDKVNKSKR